jgi:hypothetical protein
MFGFFKRKQQSIDKQVQEVKREAIIKKSEAADRIIARFEHRHESIPVTTERRKEGPYVGALDHSEAV